MKRLRQVPFPYAFPERLLQMMIERTSRTLRPGRFYPLGASVEPDGVNFALFTKHAREVYLLLFDEADGEATDIIRLEHVTRHIRHVFVEGVKPGQLYAYRVSGEYDPPNGLRYNEHKLLLDPYVKAITGKVTNADGLLYPYDRAGEADEIPDTRDSAPTMPKGIVVDDAFDWQGDVSPQVEFDKMLIYEVHLKGFTAHPSSKVQHPGTYLGFIEKIPYLKELGVNAVEFLPVQEFYVEDFLVTNGLTNYWGYNTICFFAPESSYSTGRHPGCQVEEFKTLVRELHRAGIEVILDVVYNHTGEGNELGPMISLKGIDNPSYYCLTGPPSDPQRYYMNYSGCGNSIQLADRHVLRLVMDSLRYWVQEMHVDGFRFDLASVLGRGYDGRFDRSSTFFEAISQDPVLSRVKLIAEPWDLHSYDAGNFPVDWSEWNGRFRDTVRKFLKGDPGQLADLGWRLTGSADLYGEGGRLPANSINYITCHDGFTLNDLVSYNGKHNEANREQNRDGSDFNHSWNCGVEGETDDPAINLLRRRMAKNFLCCLLLSSGTPLLLGGDEFLRTQRGNNNAYCQDNGISWFDWNEVEKNRDIFEFSRKLISFASYHPLLRRRKFFAGCRLIDGIKVCDIAWFDENGRDPAWDAPEARAVCYQLHDTDAVTGKEDYLFIILNAGPRRKLVQLPDLPGGRKWCRVIDTSLPAGDDFVQEGSPLEYPAEYLTASRSIAVLMGCKTG